VPYFLDGNNLIGLARRTSRPGEEDRAALLAEISSRLRTTRASVRIFFDGEGKGLSLGNLTVGASSGSADEAILRALGASKDPEQITVVTADRDLARRVRDGGGKTMPPPDFWSRFGGAGEGRPSPGKVDVDEWLDYFSLPENRDE